MTIFKQIKIGFLIKFQVNPVLILAYIGTVCPKKKSNQEKYFLLQYLFIHLCDTNKK